MRTAVALRSIRGHRPRAFAEYLRLPTWPAPLIMSLAFAWEEGRALKGRQRIGTSLFAVATRGR